MPRMPSEPISSRSGLGPAPEPGSRRVSMTPFGVMTRTDSTRSSIWKIVGLRRALDIRLRPWVFRPHIGLLPLRYIAVGDVRPVCNQRTRKWPLSGVFVGFSRQYVRLGHYGGVGNFFVLHCLAVRAACIGRELINALGRTTYQSPLCPRKRPSATVAQHVVMGQTRTHALQQRAVAAGYRTTPCCLEKAVRLLHSKSRQPKGRLTPDGVNEAVQRPTTRFVPAKTDGRPSPDRAKRFVLLRPRA